MVVLRASVSGCFVGCLMLSSSTGQCDGWSVGVFSTRDFPSKFSSRFSRGFPYGSKENDQLR